MDGWNKRSAMIRTQLEQRGIHDARVLDAMARVPRHLFVPEASRDRAYGDHALPITEGQTISQPYIVALMAQALELSPGERVLEVGAGSGYAAAVLSLLAGQVYAVECRPGLAESATRRLRELGYANVHIVATDGTEGLPEYAPFDGIMVSAAAPWVPLPLREQLGEGGRLVVPVGGRNAQLMLRLKRSDHQLHSERLGEVRFVPLIGAHAWHDSGDPLANEGE